MLKKTQIIILTLSIILIISIVIILVTRPVKTQSSTNITPIITPSISLLDRSPTITAQKVKSLLLPKLPLEIHNFPTSVGITTDIVISSYNNDSPEMIRLEIFGLDYQYNQNDPKTNPNMVAFKESFAKAVEILNENKIDIRDLHLSLSNKQYIREIAENWINILHLLP